MVFGRAAEDAPEAAMKPLHQSGMKVAADCLARFNAERNEGIDGVTTAADVGSLVHCVVEYTYRGTATGNRAPLDVAMEELRKHPFAKAFTPHVYAEAERIIRAAYGPDSDLWLKIPGRGEKMAVEWSWGLTEDFKPCKPDAPECAYRGRVDELRWGEKGVRERDWKTVRRWIKNEDVIEDVQRRVYAVAILAHFPMAPWVRSSFVMLRHGYEPSAKLERDEPWHKQTISWMTAVRRAVLAAEESGEWPATPGASCDYCPLRYKCEPLQALIEQGSVPEDVAPETAARRYLALTKLSAAYKRIAEKAAEDAPIPVGIGKVLGFKDVEKKQWTSSIPDRLEHLRQSGASDEDLAAWFPDQGTRATLSKKAMEHALTELAVRGEIEDPDAELRALMETVPGVRFMTFQQGES